MVTDELVKNQKTTATQVDAEYTVVVSGAGTTCEEKPVLKALLPGIRLHFLRYGLFYKKDKNNHAIRIKDNSDDKFTFSDVDASNDMIKSTENFVVAQTTVREGFIYLINDEDKNDHHELKTDGFGNLSHIVWDTKNQEKDSKKPKNFRTNNGDSSHFKLVVNKEKDSFKKFHICFSPVQWSYEYHQKMLDDAELRKKHMTLIECKGIKKGEEEAIKDVLPYNKVEFAYNNKQYTKGRIEEVLRQTDQQEKRDEKKGANELYEDMFITLHDPIGCASDIGAILIDEHNKHQSLITSIQTGESNEKIYERLKNNQFENNINNSYQEQVNGLFSTALTTYQLIYNNTDLEDEYADTTDKNKLLKILAVSERKKQREQIAIIRNEFGNFISGDYYDNYLTAFLEKSNDNVFQANFWVASQLSLLAIHPHHRDRQIDLTKDYTGGNDPWKSFFEKILCGDTAIGKLLEKEIKLEELNENPIDAAKGYDISAKLITTFDAIVAGYAAYVTQETDFNVVLKYVKSFKHKGESVIKIKKKQAKKAVRDGFLLNTSKWVEENKLVKGKKGHKYFYIKTSLNKAERANIQTNKNVSLPVKGTGGSAKAKWLFKVLNSSRFKAFVAGLELISTAINFNELSKKSDFKNFVNTSGALLSLSSASGSYAESRMVAKGFQEGIGVAGFVGNAAKITGFVGSGVGVVMCVWDSIDSAQARDMMLQLPGGLQEL